jgi:hypothetical protein
MKTTAQSSPMSIAPALSPGSCRTCEPVCGKRDRKTHVIEIDYDIFENLQPPSPI